MSYFKLRGYFLTFSAVFNDVINS